MTERDVAIIKGMLRRGDRHMDIATYFQVNQARISEIKTGKRFGKKHRAVAPADPSELPPVGPYVVVAKASVDEMQIKAAAHQRLVEQLELWLSSLKCRDTEIKETFSR